VIVKVATIYQINCFRPLVGNARNKFALLYNTSSWSFTFYAGFSTAIKYAIEIMELSCSANNSFREAPRAIKSRRNQRINHVTSCSLGLGDNDLADYANRVARVDVSVRIARMLQACHRGIKLREGDISKCKTHYHDGPRGTGPHIIWSIKITRRRYSTQPCDARALVTCV